MLQVRIQPLSSGKCFISIECECGSSVQGNTTAEESFKYEVALGGEDISLRCRCMRQYLIHPQQDHLHVSSLGFGKPPVTVDQPSCPDCGQSMNLYGAGWKCLHCGATSGCS